MHKLIRMDGETFGQWSRGVRERLNLNQVEMAQRIGYNQSHLSKIELDKQHPTADYVIAFCNATGQDRDVGLSKAGLGGERVDSKNEALAELRAEFDTLSTEDQKRLISIARGLRAASDGQRGARKKRIRAA